MVDVGAWLDTLVERMNREPELIQGVEAVYHLCLTGEGGGSYYLAIEGGTARRLDVPTADPTASVTLPRKDFEALVEQKTTPMHLFLLGKVRLDGDLRHALRLESLLRR